MLKIIVFCFGLGTLLTVQAENLVKNHNFSDGVDDQGVPLGWRLTLSNAAQGGAEVLPNQPQPGKFTLHLFKSSPEGTVNLTQTVRLKPNTEYEYYVRGRRNAAYRWHYFGIRCPGTTISQSGHLFQDDTPAPPVRFRSHLEKTLCYLTLALWSREESKQNSIGEMWVEEVVLREINTPDGKIVGLGNYFFPDDQIAAILWLQNFSGVAIVSLQSNQREWARQEWAVVPGNNPFTLPVRQVPAGLAELRLTAGNISLSQPIIIQEGIFP